MKDLKIYVTCYRDFYDTYYFRDDRYSFGTNLVMANGNAEWLSRQRWRKDSDHLDDKTKALINSLFDRVNGIRLLKIMPYSIYIESRNQLYEWREIVPGVIRVIEQHFRTNAQIIKHYE